MTRETPHGTRRPNQSEIDRAFVTLRGINSATLPTGLSSPAHCPVVQPHYSDGVNETPVTTVNTGPQRVSCQVAVPAEPSEIFDLVADPHRHPELDGSGTVRARDVKGPDRLTVGAKFGVGMTMKPFGLPYAITSTCTAFEEDRLVEWQHPMGHKWRWELEPGEPGTTVVTETFDYSTAKVPAVIRLTKFDETNRVGITKTLEALVRRFA